MLIQTEKIIAIAHLVQTADEKSPCRRLHGHNLRVVVTINGEIKDDGMIVDFRYIKTIINNLDHRTIIPGSLVVSEEDGLLYIETGYSKMALSITEVIVLNLPVITAETLTIYFVSEIKKIVDIDDYVTVCVYESEKSFAEADSDDII
jgi:6-pyruvoyl-tetrahydropterin synthase